MRNPIVYLISSLFVLLLLGAASASDALINAEGDSKVAIRGYDPVAYFTEGQPTLGKAEFAHRFRDATWHFSSGENKETFAADPERYAPQYGGFCAMAMTEGEIKVIDPEAWTIVDGKLYLNFSMMGREKFRADLSGNIEKSDIHWGELQAGN